MPAPTRDEITQIRGELEGVEDESSLAALLPQVYDELRALADSCMRGERADHTLQATALVNEAYLRLAKDDARFNDRKHFYRTAAIVMRRILINHAIERRAQKRGGGSRGKSLADLTVAMAERDLDLVALDEALKCLIELDEQKGRVVELRFFGGCTIEETAEYLEISPRTVERHWDFARAWLRSRLEDEGTSDRVPTK